jgi:hypothetical protein
LENQIFQEVSLMGKKKERAISFYPTKIFIKGFSRFVKKILLFETKFFVKG